MYILHETILSISVNTKENRHRKVVILLVRNDGAGGHVCGEDHYCLIFHVRLS